VDFWGTVVVLFRRWYVTVPAFFATLFLAFVAFSAVPIQFESGGVLVLTTPLNGGTEYESPDHTDSVTNPMMNFDQSLGLTASLVIQQLRSRETAEALGVHPGGTTSYEVNNGTSNPELLQSGPFIFIKGTGPSPQDAKDMADRVAASAQAILDQRQKEVNAPASTHIEVEVVVAPTAGLPLLGSPLRAAAGVGALAALVGLVAVYGFENLVQRRQLRRARRQQAGAADGAAATVRDRVAAESSVVEQRDPALLVRAGARPGEP
jgi:hypothetical protein